MGTCGQQVNFVLSEMDLIKSSNEGGSLRDQDTSTHSGGDSTNLSVKSIHCNRFHFVQSTCKKNNSANRVSVYAIESVKLKTRMTPDHAMRTISLIVQACSH